MTREGENLYTNSTFVIQRYLRKKNKDLRSFQTEQYKIIDDKFYVKPKY